MSIGSGYEASSIELVEDVLDAGSPDSGDVYLETLNVSERAIAAVAAARANAGGVAALDWHNVTGGVGFGAGFADFGAPFPVVAYAIDDAFLYFRGVASGTGTGNVFTLPVGFRPAVMRLLSPHGFNTSVTYVTVATTGIVHVESQGAAITAVNLEGVALAL